MSDKNINMSTRNGTVVITTPASVGTQTGVVINGLARWVEVLAPALTGTGTVTTAILSPAGGTLFTVTQDESVRSATGTTFPLPGTVSIVATANGTQGASVNVAYSIYYEA